MKQQIYLLSLILLFCLNSCGDGQQNQNEGEVSQEELYDEVMAVHDEVMPRMGDLMNYQSQLKGKIDSLPEGQAEETESLQSVVDELEEAHDAMMGWMRNFNRDYEGMTEEEVMEYLRQEKEKIEEVKEKMNSALQEAESAV